MCFGFDYHNLNQEVSFDCKCAKFVCLCPEIIITASIVTWVETFSEGFQIGVHLLIIPKE